MDRGETVTETETETEVPGFAALGSSGFKAAYGLPRYCTRTVIPYLQVGRSWIPIPIPT